MFLCTERRPLGRLFLFPHLPSITRSFSDSVCISDVHVGNPCRLPILFFACPKKRTKRKGSHATETTPVAKARNRRGKQRVDGSNRRSLRSDSLPLHPAPTLAARLSDDGPYTRPPFFQKIKKIRPVGLSNPKSRFLPGSGFLGFIAKPARLGFSTR